MASSFDKDLDRLIRARYSLLYILSWEEKRAIQVLMHIAKKQDKSLFEWSITDGLHAITDRTPGGGSSNRAREPMKMLNKILQYDGAAIYILKDIHAFLDSPELVRQLRDLAFALRRTRKTIIILSPVLKIPPELEKAITILDFPLPSYMDLSRLLQSIIDVNQNKRSYNVNLDRADFDRLVRAAQGLTLQEAESAFAQGIVEGRVLDGNNVEAVIAEKKQIIRKSGVLDYYDPTETMNNVGGMDLLKIWLNKRARAFSEEAREYGLPQPRGALLLGVQGCGKSLIAKSIASFWRLPLLRMDMSRIFEGYIGSSEQNMRRALKVAESLAPAILWIDEIEKAFSGVGGSASSDAGTTSRVVGTFLTWMQEKTVPIFVVATANDVQCLPPELLRKGRFDEIFFVDLPKEQEREEIFSIHLRCLKRDPANFNADKLVSASMGYGGAEIEQAIISAMHDSFVESREVDTNDIVRNLKETVPLSRTMREKIDDLRVWARDRARPVSSLQDNPSRDLKS